MKKSLLTLMLALAVLLPVAMNAASSAPVKRSVAAQESKKILKQQSLPKLFMPGAKMETAQMRVPGMPVVKAPLKAGEKDIWYRRPAGAFPGIFALEGQTFVGTYFLPFLCVTPYVDYTFIGNTVGVSDNATYEWNVQYTENTGYSDAQRVWTTVSDADKNLTWQWGNELDSVPVFKVMDGADNLSWFLKGYNMNEAEPLTYSAMILSAPKVKDELDYNLLKSSKTFCPGGRYGNQPYLWTSYSGANPYGNNDYGYWFGKNGGNTNATTGRTDRIDGIAQAFEKPTAPYQLMYVAMYCGILDVTTPVDLTCKVYKLDDIPAYNDTGTVTLPEVPGELIATGRATVTPSTYDDTNGMVFFTLLGAEILGDDVLEYEVNPTIDCPILVVLDGYNEPQMNGLTNFTAMVSADDQVDEGFGELAYLKYGYVDENNNLDHYEWVGLNNFFDTGTMMTGFTIFLGTENPWLLFNYSAEDGEYLFPDDGGDLVKEIHLDGEETIVAEGIEFFSNYPSSDGVWSSYNLETGDEYTDWLSIDLTDGEENGKFNGVVTANVFAEPLPEDVRYREMVVRFEVPGAYLDYKFMQGDSTPLTYDFEVDGIYYKTLDSNTVAVTCKDENYNTYMGVVVIPETVSYQGVDYEVKEIGKHAFKDCFDLISLSIPCSVTSIASNAFSGVDMINFLIITGNEDWQAGCFPKDVNHLIIKDNVQSIHGLETCPSAIFCYNPTPPECDENTFTAYDASLQVPKKSLASYFTAPYWCNFADLTNNAIEPTSVAIDKDSVNLILNEEIQLTANVSPSNATPNYVMWTSTDYSVVYITDNGVIQSISEGECDVLACCADQMAVCHVTVTDVHPDSIMLSENSITLEIDEQHELTATVLPENAYYETITWLSSDSRVAVVEDGMVTAVGGGECDITVFCRDIQAVCHVKVVEPVIHITLDQHEARMQPNQMLTLYPTMTPEPTELMVTSSDQSVALARIAAGKVQVVSVNVGTAVITVGSVDGMATPDSCLVIVNGGVGDVNGDGVIGIVDVTTLIDYLLSKDETLVDLDSSDVNGDGLIDIADATSLIDYVLNGTWPWETLAKPKTKHVVDISPATVCDFINKSISL